MTARRTLVVPDPQSWAVWGLDLRAAGVEPAVAAEHARALLLPARVPAAMTAAVREAVGRIPGDVPPTVRPAPMDGAAAGAVLSGEAPGHPGHDVNEEGSGHENSGPGHDGHEDSGPDHDGHEDGGHDMMAIVGEPSADGLVMEDVELTVGPLAPGLPGGLVTRLALDGDVVAGARVEATLAVARGAITRGLSPDPLAPLAWRAVLGRARGAHAPQRLAALEVERALSHAAWLCALATILGHARLGDLAARAVAALITARTAVLMLPGSTGAADTTGAAGAAATAFAPLDALHALCIGDRGLRTRLGGLGVIDPAELEARRVGGPVARAAGLDRDARTGDAAYAPAGFRVILGERGDALARTRLRAAEASAAVRLASALLDPSAPDGSSCAPSRSDGREASVGRGVRGARLGVGGREMAAAPGHPAVVEEPRGPLHVIAAPGGTPAVAAPGHAALLELAGRATCGLELASAMAVLVSFDLSPWRVGP